MSIENLPTFPADKANHYIYGSFAAADGEPPAHDASKADARATAKGSIPVVAVLVVLQLLAVV